MSEIESAPISFADAREPSWKLTWIADGLPLPDEPATTWLLVMMYPSSERMTPDPSPASDPLTTSIDTTDGSVLAATSCTDPAGAAATF